MPTVCFSPVCCKYAVSALCLSSREDVGALTGLSEPAPARDHESHSPSQLSPLCLWHHQTPLVTGSCSSVCYHFTHQIRTKPSQCPPLLSPSLDNKLLKRLVYTRFPRFLSSLSLWNHVHQALVPTHLPKWIMSCPQLPQQPQPATPLPRTTSSLRIQTSSFLRQLLLSL